MKTPLLDFDFPLSVPQHYAALAELLGLVAGMLLTTWLLIRLVIPLIQRIVHHTENKWDDYLLNRPVLYAASYLVPAVAFYNVLPLWFNTPATQAAISFNIVSNLSEAYITFCTMLLVTNFLKNLSIVSVEELREHHLVGILQFLRLLTFCLGGIVMLALIFGHNPLRVIAGLGAAATVLLLVFKDSILGLVAGIQLSANHMLKVGDWITIKKSDINGVVEQVTLTTVKVRNFDNTISTIPPYTLVSDAFQNWSGMFELQGRRVKRALFIDISTVRLVEEEALERLKRRKFVTKADMDDYEKEGGITNLTLFRRYAERLLKADPNVKQEQWALVRQLDPTPTGLPLELWFYFRETNFGRFEALSAERFEKLIAVMPEFDLRCFQQPSGSDVLMRAKSETAHPKLP